MIFLKKRKKQYDKCSKKAMDQCQGRSLVTNNIRWGLDNPHPFSQMKTELIWEGKYDEYGKLKNNLHIKDWPEGDRAREMLPGERTGGVE